MLDCFVFYVHIAHLRLVAYGVVELFLLYICVMLYYELFIS